MATRQASKPRHKEGEARGTPKPARASSAKRASTRKRRYAVVYDIDGPRVRLGVLWFVVAAAALAVGPLAAAVVYGGAAAIGAAQMARVWRRHRQRPHQMVAAGMAGGMVLGACLGAGGAGLGILAGTVFAIAAATADTKSPNAAVTDIGWTIQCALPIGLAATSMVLLARLDQGSAIGLLLLVSAYETGDYIVGSGARNPYEGPAAGICALTVVTFILSTLPISTLDFGQAWLFGGLVAILAPLGQLFASALLPNAGAPASGLRRLDSLLLAAPVWCVGVGLVV